MNLISNIDSILFCCQATACPQSTKVAAGQHTLHLCITRSQMAEFYRSYRLLNHHGCESLLMQLKCKVTASTRLYDFRMLSVAFSNSFCISIFNEKMNYLRQFLWDLKSLGNQRWQIPRIIALKIND